MTASRLKREEDEDDGIRRVANEQAADAVELLRDEDADPVEAVHEARPRRALPRRPAAGRLVGGALRARP